MVSFHVTHVLCREQGIKRAEKFAEWLRSDGIQSQLGDDGLFIIVSHAEFLDALLQRLLNTGVMGEKSTGAKGDRGHVFRLENTSHSLVEISGNAIGVRWLNRSDHLFE